MKKVIRFFDIFVFIATTLAIAGVFYEGMELKWFDIVGILKNNVPRYLVIDFSKA